GGVPQMKRPQSGVRLPPVAGQPQAPTVPVMARPNSAVRMPPVNQQAPAAQAQALGIDLGSTYSMAAYLDSQGRPVSLPNAHGDTLTPSVVLSDADGVIVGKEAVTGAALEPEKVADLFKRDMGKRLYRRKVNGWELPPEAISGFVLRCLKDD